MSTIVSSNPMYHLRRRILRRQAIFRGGLLGTAAKGVIYIWLTSFQVLAAEPVLMVDEEIELSSAPARASMIIIDQTGVAMRTAGLCVVGAKEAVGSYMCGGPVRLSGDMSQISYFLVVETKGGSYEWRYRHLRTIENDLGISLTSVLLEEHIERRKKFLAELVERDKLQSEDLRRLEADAEVITNVQRIVDAKGDIQAASRELDRTLQNIEVLREQLKFLKTEESPRNYTRREADLSGQINQLTSLSKLAEGGDLGPHKLAVQEMQEKMELISRTKHEHLDLLQKELDRMKRIRERLEVKVVPATEPELPSERLPAYDGFPADD